MCLRSVGSSPVMKTRPFGFLPSFLFVGGASPGVRTESSARRLTHPECIHRIFSMSRQYRFFSCMISQGLRSDFQRPPRRFRPCPTSRKKPPSLGLTFHTCFVYSSCMFLVCSVRLFSLRFASYSVSWVLYVARYV